MKREKQFLVGLEYTFSEIVKYFCGEEFETDPDKFFYESDALIIQEYGDWTGTAAINVTDKNRLPDEANLWFVFHDLTDEGGIYKCVYNTLVY